jgi:flagellar hook-associated protein 1 FlgK
VSISSLLNLGANGMAASNFGANVASQGASNVATEGYTRRVATLVPLGQAPAGGNGVQALGARRSLDPFVEKRLLGVRSSAGEATARSDALATLDEIFTDGGIGTSLDEFEAAIADVAARPGETAPRTVLLSAADALARSFTEAGARVAEARSDVNGKLTAEVGTINQRLEKIAALGREITRTEVDGREASDLRDQRDQLVREVSTQIPVTVMPQADGQVSLLLAGRLELVSRDGKAHLLTASRDPGTGDTRVTAVEAGAAVDVTRYSQSGTIGGLISARDGAITTAATRLDQLAFDVATAYNAAHGAGVDLDGSAGTPLFNVSATVAGAAQSLSLSATVAGQPRKIAAAQDAASLPGDNRNALALRALSTTFVASSGTRTANEAFADAGAELGTAIARALGDRTHTEDAKVQVESLRASISGVSLDEEMTNLMRYQRAYQASLQVVQVADEMLTSLLALRR